MAKIEGMLDRIDEEASAIMADDKNAHQNEDVHALMRVAQGLRLAKGGCSYGVELPSGRTLDLSLFETGRQQVTLVRPIRRMAGLVRENSRISR